MSTVLSYSVSTYIGAFGGKCTWHAKMATTHVIFGDLKRPNPIIHKAEKLNSSTTTPYPPSFADAVATVAGELMECQKQLDIRSAGVLVFQVAALTKPTQRCPPLAPSVNCD